MQPVPRGEIVPPDAVRLQGWPEDKLPPDTIDNLEDVVGYIATTDFIVEQPVRSSWVRRVVLDQPDIALAIPRGKVAYAIPVRILSTVAQAVRPGSYVDVLISFSVIDVDQDSQIKLPLLLTGDEDCLAGCQPTGEQVPALVTQYTVQNALVLGVGLLDVATPGIEVLAPGEEPGEEPEVPIIEPTEGEEGEAPPPEEPVVQSFTQVTAVTLAVGPQEALVLKWAWESRSSLDLVMRSVFDKENFAQPEAVTLKYMLDRFQITLPPKLPHVPENKFDYGDTFEETVVTAPQE
jgi:Flp pilus assembly protein CpaB